LFAGLLAGGTAARADDAPLGGPFEDWKKIGDFAWASEVAVAPSCPSRVMAAGITDLSDELGGIYRSDNGGDDWTMAAHPHRCSNLAINPSDPNVILLAEPGG
jgi:hypothetical protein